jgi:hypothetical protein
MPPFGSSPGPFQIRQIPQISQIPQVPRIPQRLSCAGAFEAQGVKLKHPSHSLSGIRLADGAVVLAIREVEVRAQEGRFSCLLWAPSLGEAIRWVDRPCRQERLEHCRLAVVHGGAEGLLLCGEAAEVDPDLVLTLRVEKRQGEYWAMWGGGAFAQVLPRGPGDRTRIFGSARMAA